MNEGFAIFFNKIKKTKLFYDFHQKKDEATCKNTYSSDYKAKHSL